MKRKRKHRCPSLHQLRRRLLVIETLENRFLLAGDPLSASQRQDLISGLGDLATWTDSLAATQQLGLPLALTGKSVGQSANLEQMINTGIVSQLNSTSQQAVDTDQFVAAIRGLSRTVGDLTISVNPASVTGGIVTGPNRNELQFTANFFIQRQNSEAVQVNFGSNVADAGLSVETALPLTTTSQLQFTLAFGLDLRPGLTAEQSFFIRPSNLSIGTSIDAINLSGNSKIGLLRTQLTGGSLDLNASVQIEFTNPDLDPLGNITLAELKQNPIDVIAFQNTTQSTLSGGLPVSAVLGSQNFNAATLGSAPTLQVSSSNVFAGSELINAIPNSSFLELQNFNNLPASGLLTALIRTGGALEELAPFMDINPDFGGFGYTDVLTSDVVNLESTLGSVARTLYDPFVQGSRAMKLGTGFSLSNDAVFTIRINNNEIVNVTVPRQSQGNGETVVSLIQRFLPASIRSRITAGMTSTDAGDVVFTFKAVDPAIAKFEILFADLNNSMYTNLGISPGAASWQSYKFDSLQSFSTLLAQNTGVQSVEPWYDIATNQLSFRTRAAGSVQTAMVPLRLEDGLGPLTISSPYSASFSVTPTFDGRIAVALDQLQSVLTGTGDAPANGQLTGPATFRVSINGASGVNVTVPRDTSNTTLDDLVADINAAIALTSLKGKLTAGRNALRLTLSSGTGTGMQVEAMAGDPAATQLKLVGTGLLTKWDRAVSLETGSQLQLNSTVTSSSLTGEASLGILPVNLTSGSMTMTAIAGGSLNRSIALFELNEPAIDDVQFATPTTALTGNFITAVAPALGIQASNPASFGLTLTTPNEWATRLVGFGDLPANGRLSSPANMLITWGKSDPVSVIVPVDSSNLNIDDLIADVNTALNATRLDGNVAARRQGNRIALVTSGFYALRVDSVAGDSTDVELRLRGTSAAPAIASTANSVFQQRLAPIGDFRLEDFIGSVQGILDLFENDHLRSFTSDLPLIDQSLDDILGVSQRLKSALVNLEAKTGLSLKLAMQAIVENLSDAIAALPESLPEGSSEDLIAVYQRLRVASLSAEQSDVPSPVNLASVIVSAIAPYTSAIAKVNQPGIDMVPLNDVLNQLRGVTPSLLQIADAFSTALGIGNTTSTFANARLNGFEQALVLSTTWTDPVTRAVPLTSIDLPSNLNLGPLLFDGGSTVTVSATRDMKFDFGFNFTTDTPFLQDTTRFNGAATMAVSSSVYTGNIGGVAVSLGHPSEPASILLRTNANQAPANFRVTLNATPDPNDIGNIPMSSAASSLDYSSVNAKLDAVLPVYITGVDRGNVAVAWTVPSTAAPVPPVVTVPPDLIPTLESSPYDFSLLTEGIAIFNERLKSLVRDEILSEFPLISQGLNIDSGFTSRLETQFYSAVVDAIVANGSVDSSQLRTDLFNNIQTALGALLVNQSLQVTSSGSPEIRFRISGNDTYQGVLDVGLPGLNFDVSSGGQVDINLNYDILLGFGISRTEGFYFIVQRLPSEPTGPQLKLDITATLALGSTMQAQLLELPVVATPKVNATGQSDTRAQGRVNATFLDQDNRLSINQVDTSLFSDELNIAIGSGGLASKISLALSANALDAITGDPDLPDFTTDLLVTQTFAAGDALTAPGAIPQVRLNDIGISLGQSISRIIQPIAERVEEYIEPIRPVIEGLNDEVPVLSDILREANQDPLTWLDAIALYTDDPDIDSVIQVIRDVVDIIEGIDDLIARLRSLTSSSRLIFGSYIFDSSFDLRIERPNGIDPFTAGTFVPNPQFTTTNDGTVSPAVSNADPAVGNLLNNDLRSQGFRFPIFENPRNVVSLLFGRDISFVTWDIPPFEVEVSTPDLYITTIPIPTPIGPIPLSIYAGLNFEFSANIGMGFDSRGFREDQEFLDGFYFRDRGASGPPVLSFAPGVELTAAVGLPVIIEVGVEAQLSADLQARWNNIDRDGRYHLDELLENAVDGPNCIMNLDGAVVANANLFFTLLGARTDIPILPETTLFDFGVYTCSSPRNPELAEVAVATPPTIDFEGQPIAPGTLVLNIGPYAERRNPGVSEDNDERIEVTQVSPGVYRVQGFGETRVYGTAMNPILRIYGDAGEGTNFVKIDNSVTIPTTLIGGTGNDELRGGSGQNRIVGRGGRDMLMGGILNDTIIAGGSSGINEAQVYGADGDDTLIAINGYNYLDGENGNDILQGGTEVDRIEGGRGDDQIFGGGGADQLFGEQDNDTIWGQGDEGVYIEGGRGNNLIYGSDGPDLIYASTPSALPGESGSNVVFARDGDDIVRGGIDNANEIHGGANNDLLYGGEVADLILAGSGTDLVYGYGGDDTIYADSGTNTIYGGVGNDLIFGSSGLAARPGNWPMNPPGFSSTYAGSGVDTIFGESGNDTIYGGVGTGTLDGGANADFIYGGTGGQNLIGGNGDDILRTGDGDQIHSGGAGNDLLEQRLGALQTLTDTTLLGRGNQSYSLIERVRLLNPSNVNVIFDISGFRGIATLVGSTASSDSVRTIVDADVTLVDGNLRTSLGTSVTLENIKHSVITGIRLDNTFDVSLWSGTALLTGGIGKDRVWSASDANYTLTDTRLNRSTGGDITLSGIRAATLAGGVGSNIIDATSFTGNAWLYGGNGDDTLRGGSGDDYLDGGTGFDSFLGNAGNDVIVATAGVAAIASGGYGDDVIYGSNAIDTFHGDAGRDRIYGRGGNDVLNGGSGDDIIDGGSGGDTISGDAGMDVLLGGADNDTIYAFNLAGTNDDGAVNYLYGDFGTAGDEPGVGDDLLRAGIGSDLSFGEGGVNIFQGGGVGAVTYNGLAAGLRPTSPPADPPIPQPTQWPPQLPGQTTTFIIDGITSRGRWTELNGSGSERGLSRSPAAADSPAVAVGAAGPWVTWIDSRSGLPQVYVALHTIAGWSEYAGSAKGGGISLQAGVPNSRAEQPSIALNADGLPIVAWTQVVGNSRDIFVARYDAAANGGAGAWLPLGDSLSVGGISGTGAAENASIVMTSAGPVVAWLENVDGIKNVHARRFENGTWVALGAGGATGSGVSASATTINQFAIASDGTNITIAWTQSVASRTQIYARTLVGNTWSALGTSTTGNGLSGTTGSASSPSLTYFSSGQLMAVWEDDSSTRTEIYAALFDGAQWVDAGAGSRTAGGVSNTRGEARAPKIAASDNQISVVWQDDRQAAGKGNSIALYTKRWKVNAFIEELPGDARDRGLTSIVGSPGTHAIALDAAGHPFVAWNDTFSGKSEIYLQVNKLDLGTVHYVNDLDPTPNSVAANSFSTAIGNDANDGLTPATPKRTLQGVLNDPLRPMNVGDVILLDAGTYVGATVSGAANTGVIIVGSIDEPAIISTPLTISNVDRLTVSRLTTNAGIAVNSATQNTYQEIDLRNAGLAISGGNSVQVLNNTSLNATTSVMVSGNAQSTVIASNTFRDGLRGVWLTSGAASQAANSITIRDNRILGAGIGISIETGAQGRISNNWIDVATTGLRLSETFAGLITNNIISNSSTGVLYGAPNTLDGNLIYGGSTGVSTSVSTTTGGFGYFGLASPNRIVNNDTGIVLSQNAVLQKQYLWGNNIGVAGIGSIIPTGFEFANVIGGSDTAVDISGTVQYTRMERNTKGLAARGSQLIAHNEFIDNSVGIDINGDSDVRVFANTIVGETGTNIRILGNSSQVEVRNNILWTNSGTNLSVDNVSTTGFFSDYNTLIAGPTGNLVYWTRNFNDILDWQEDVYRYDLHSAGTTVVNPRAAEPQFVSRSLNDYRVFDQVARLRITSPSVDVGDPLADQARSTDFVNLLSNPSFELGLNSWTVTPATSNLGASNPLAYDSSNYFRGGTGATVLLEQTVDLVVAGFLPATIDSLQYTAIFGGRVRSANEFVADRGTLTVDFLDAASNTIGSPFVIQASNVSDRWELIGDKAYLPAQTRRIRFRYEGNRSSGTTNDIYLDNAFVSLLPRVEGIDSGALGNASTDVDTAPHLRLISPDLYKDWERNKAIDIRWDSVGNTAGSAVAIKLLQDSSLGPQFVTNITTSTVDDGSFTWIAANSGVNFGTKGLRIEVSLVGNPTVFDRSTETFTVPEDTTTYFVNDRFSSGDEFTSSLGSNRNTGKLSASPKPYPNNVLRIYSLGAGASLSIDAGDYPMQSPLRVTNLGSLGDDEGFLVQGASGRDSRLSHANPLTTAPILELVDADFMTVNNLTLVGGTTGLVVRDGSSNFNADGLRSLGALQQGMTIDSGSNAQTLTRLLVDGSLGSGISIQGPLGSLTDSIIRNNRGTGLNLTNVGAASIEANQIYNNTGSSGTGVFITETGSAPPVFGSPSLAPGRGNVVYGNSFGIRVQGIATVAGNTIYNHVGVNVSGIEVSGAADVIRNVVYGNSVGVTSNGASPITENRIYNNSSAGIIATGGTPILRNVVYSNSVGIETSNYSGTISNNVIYANSDASILLSRSGNATILNNTIVQTVGDGVRINNLSSGTRIRNNSIWAQGGFAINVSSDSQSGFFSDYNNLFATGSGAIARWQNVTRPTMASWRSTAFTDFNSLNVDPSFVSLVGADGVLGFNSTTNDGRDDDMHLRSQFGTFQGISFAPVATASGTGAPTFLTSSSNPVMSAVTSKLIDRGEPNDSFSAEPLPNGGAINIGAYGGTNQAAISPAEYVTVTNPDGAEIWPIGQSVSVRWRNQQPSASVTFKIDLVKGNTSVLTISDSAPNTGLFDWTVPPNTAVGDDYRIQVIRNDNTAIADLSDGVFSIRPPVSVYYVNDGTVVAGDYTIAAGNFSNSGLSPSSPLDSIGSVLTRYVVKAGDTILVDAGTYTLSTALVLNAAASGITIRGFADPSNPARATILDRANTNFNAIELVNADDVTLDRLTIRNANNGVFASETSDSDRLTISNSTFETSLNRAMVLGTTSDFANIQGSRLSRGVLLSGPDSTVNGNAFLNMPSGTALDIRGIRTLVTNNTFSNILGGAVNVATSGATNASRVIVRQNTFTDVATGFAASDNTLVQDNVFVRANVAIFSYGEVRENVIRDGVNGIISAGTTFIEDNRVYMNSGTGLTIGINSTTFNNYFYNNNVGIAASSGFTGEIANNFLVNNVSSGISVILGGGPTITNNTVIQSTGDAIRLSSVSTQNVNVKNNILQVHSGYAINVDSDAGRGFRSDYNIIHALGTGKIGRWQGIDFTNAADWFFEVGLDKNTTFGDPQFVDLDGPDNVLGFSRGSGISASYFANSTLSGSPLLTRTETVIGFAVGGGAPVVGLPVDNFSVRYDGFLFIPSAGTYTFFETADNGVRLFLEGSSTPLIDNWSSNGTEQSYSANFASAGWIPFRLEYRELTGFASLALNWSGPGFSKRPITPDYLSSTPSPNVGDYGQDDSFAVSSSSPGIDGGNPDDYYFREPLPNGGRLNIGASGNSISAEVSPLQSVQVLSPNGLEKFEQGQAVPINIRSSGLLLNQPTMLLNVGVNSMGPWGNGSKFQTAGVASGAFGNEFTNAVIDRSGVTDPIPEELYRNYLASNTGANASLRLQLPVADGTYSMRLHFIEGIATAAGTRRFDIKINGTTVRAGYDIFANAGARFRAVSETLSGLVASGGSGLLLELTTLTPSFQALLSALEIFTAAPLGTSTSSVSLEFSNNGGSQWSPIPGANAVPIDRWGNGSFTWSLPVNLPEGNNYRIRARGNVGIGELVDTSDAPFIVSNSGNDYYVNDSVVAGDFFTTAPGSNAASGKSPDQPLASLTALLSSYSFQSGDVIHIDTGNHRLIRTLTLTNRFNGVRFEGPASGTAVLDRNNTSFNMFDLQNADDLSFDRLTFRNATYSLFANDVSDSDRLSIQRSSFLNNQSGAIFLGVGSDFTTLENNNFNMSTQSNVILSGTDAFVTENQFSNSGNPSIALEIRGARSQVTSNTFSNVRSAISIQPSGFSTVADRVIVTNNMITDANGTAINLGGTNTLVENNVITRAITGVSGSGEIRNNVLRDGTTGMRVINSLVEDNRIFNHSGSGLVVLAGTITRNNRIYNNDVGVETELGFNGTISNNYLVNNTDAGFSIVGAGYNGGIPTYSQNTIFQSIGDAFRVTDFRTNSVLIENNIIQVGRDYAYNISPDATRGFRADYNLIHRIGTGKIARWENTDFNDSTDWYYEVGRDQNSIFADPLFVDLDGLDNQLGYSTTLNTDFGADDSFSVQSNSPAVDSGNPNSIYALESVPNGGRVNLGGTANSNQAEISSSQSIQVLSPDGLEKFERGQIVPVAVNTNGIRNIQPTLLVNGGGASVGRWLPGNRFTTTGLVGAGNTELATATIDRSGVVDPPPEDVYRTLSTADSNPGGRLAMKLPVANGTYSVRLHFIEGQVTTVGARRFDIRINGTTLRANYDIFQAAGSVRFNATAETFSNIIAANGDGLTVELVSLTGTPATIAAIEVFQAAPIGTTTPTVALEFSSDAGENWTPISGANAVPVDRWGNVSFNWLVPSSAIESTSYRIRARATGAFGTVEDVSDASFTVANNGLAYYLSPAGDNRNSGKQVDQPMRSLAGLIEAYDLDAGDVVELLGGSYRTYRNINLGPNDSGVTLLAGPNNPATINRGNTNALMRVVDFTGADGTTINGLRLTGGENGIMAVSDLSSTNNVITNSQLFGNLVSGLYVGTGNPDWQITNSKFYGLPGGSASDNQSYGVYFAAAGPNTSTGYQFLANDIYDNSAVGIWLPTAGTVIEGNSIYGNQQGIAADSGGLTTPLVIRKNKVRENLQLGISVTGTNMFVTDNDIYGHRGDGDRGVVVNGGAIVANNRIYDNRIGAEVAGSSGGTSFTTFIENRVYGNSSIGIDANSFAQINGNYVYSNSIGIRANSQFLGDIQNNVIYANTNRGISIQNPSIGSANARYTNNTIYQAVGDGVRLEGASRNNILTNNIIWVLTGFAVNVAADSQIGFQSNYNALAVGNDPNANTGLWGGVARKSLADWQAATNQDANSISGQPSFVDIDGADNVLGYVTTPAGQIHGGTDDNFYISRNSPVIDRGSTWSGTSGDMEGFGRSDDPGTINAGASRYSQSTQPITSFPATGVAQNWRNDNSSWQFNLPYSFPFFGTNYSSLWVSSNGFIDLGPFDFNAFGDPNNSQAKLLQFTRIAPLWDDLTTANPGDDIFVDSSIAGQTTFRWNATNKANNADVHFSVTIGSDGRIEFLYGTGVNGLSPTAGISRGNRRNFELAIGIDNATTISGLQANHFPIVAGITDIGAYEFRGSSLDTQPPTLVGSFPSAIHASGVTALSLSSLQLNFSEEVNPIDARSPAAYELRSAGINDNFGDADDVVYPIRPQYTPGQNSVQLVIGALDGGSGTSLLPIGRYQVTVLGASGASIYDLAGNQFDGNVDGTAGGNYARVFRVINNEAPQLFGSNPLPTIFSSTSNADNTGLRVADLVSNQIVDQDGPARGIAITNAGVAGGTWEYSLDGVVFQSVASSLLGGQALLLAADSDTRVRFVPLATSSGLISTLTLRAWDQADELPEGTTRLPEALSANSLSSTFVNASIMVVAPSIPSQRIYYRGSSFAQGGNNIPAALDPNKEFVRSGNTTKTLTYANLINTTRGINGVVLDISGLAASSLTIADFVFRMSPTGLFNEAANPPSAWVNAPNPTGIFVTAGTQNTPARVRIEWNDNDIANRWLQIQVIANSNTGLPSTNVFYVGHLQGEVNGSVTGGAFFVTTLDQSGVLPLGIATVGNNRDIDKNGFVTSNDLTAVRVSVNAGRSLRVITIPIAGSSNEGTTTGDNGLLSSDEVSSSTTNYQYVLNSTAVPLSQVATAPKDESKPSQHVPENPSSPFSEEETVMRTYENREDTVPKQQSKSLIAKSKPTHPASRSSELKALDIAFSELGEEW